MNSAASAMIDVIVFSGCVGVAFRLKQMPNTPPVGVMLDVGMNPLNVLQMEVVKLSIKIKKN